MLVTPNLYVLFTVSDKLFTGTNQIFIEVLGKFRKNLNCFY